MVRLWEFEERKRSVRYIELQRADQQQVRFKIGAFEWRGVRRVEIRIETKVDVGGQTVTIGQGEDARG